MTLPALLLALMLTPRAAAAAENGAPATRPRDGKLPHIDVDVKKKQVRVECEAVNAEMPLEFFCCVTNTAEHEAALRSAVRPSHLHLALLMCGLVPGEPVRYSKALDKWLPPKGPPVHIFCEFERDGKKVSIPAYRMLRNTKTKKEMPPITWVFTGSKMTEDGKYAGDMTGYLVTVVNFELSVIDIPLLASNSNETLEWEVNPDIVPKKGSPVTMIIEPAGKDAGRGGGGAGGDNKAGANANTPIDERLVTVDAAGRIELDHAKVELKDLTERLERLKEKRPLKVQFAPAADAPKDFVERTRAAIELADVAVTVGTPGGAGDPALSEVKVDEMRVKQLRARWEKSVAPHRRELAVAAQTHYEVINSLRREQQRLIDEADRVQRVIDDLQRDYQDMTTPRPEPDDR